MLQVLPHRTPSIKEMANMDDIDDLSRPQYGVAPWLSRSISYSISIGIGLRLEVVTPQLHLSLWDLSDLVSPFVRLRRVCEVLECDPHCKSHFNRWTASSQVLVGKTSSFGKGLLWLHLAAPVMSCAKCCWSKFLFRTNPVNMTPFPCLHQVDDGVYSFGAPGTASGALRDLSHEVWWGRERTPQPLVIVGYFVSFHDIWHLIFIY